METKHKTVCFQYAYAQIFLVLVLVKFIPSNIDKYTILCFFIY